MNIFKISLLITVLLRDGTVEEVSELRFFFWTSHLISASRGTGAKRSLNDWKVESLSLVQVLIFILLLFSDIDRDLQIFVLALKRQIVD